MVSREIPPRSDSRDELAKAQERVSKLEMQVEGEENFGVYDEFVGPLPEGEVRYSEYAQAREEAYQGDYDEQGLTRAMRDGDNYRDAATGRYTSEPGQYNPNQYYSDKLEQSIEGERPYEDMTLQELAQKWGESERLDDRSTASEVVSAIDAKMQEKAESMGWSKETMDLHYATLADIADRARSSEVVGDDIETQELFAIPEADQERLRDLRSSLEQARKDGNTEGEYTAIDDILRHIDSIEGMPEGVKQQLIDGIKEQSEVAGDDVELEVSPAEIVIGDKVSVERSSGEMESDWKVADVLTRSDGSIVYEVSSVDPETGDTLYKFVDAETLASWQSSGEVGPEASEAMGEAEGEGSEQLEKFDVSDLEEGEADDPLKIEVDISKEIKEAIDEAGDRYAALTAKARKSYMGHLLRDSKFWVKIPGLKQVAELINSKTDKSLEEARLAYEDSITAAQDEIDRQYIEAVDEETLKTEEFEKALKMARKLMLLEAQPGLEAKIVKEREAQSGKTNKFVNWWVSRNSVGGKVVKALAVAGVGVGTGVAASLLTVPALGAVLGGTAGLLIANHVTKRRANAVNREGVTLAQQQSNEDLARQQEIIETQSNDAEYNGDVNITGAVEDRTSSEQRGNRARVKTATAIGAAGGTLGAAAGEAIKGAFEAAAQPTPEVTPDPTIEPSATEVPPAVETAPPAPEVLGTNFDIQSGSGFTQELMDFAGANGHNLSPDQSYELHNELLNAFGNYIQDGAGNPISTYTQGADLRISAPGSGQWAPGVADYVKTWMGSRGLW